MINYLVICWRWGRALLCTLGVRGEEGFFFFEDRAGGKIFLESLGWILSRLWKFLLKIPV